MLQREEPSPDEFEKALESDSTSPQWSGEPWRDEANPTPDEMKEVSGKTVSDYQSSFGPDLGAYMARTNGDVGGGGGSWSGGGGPIQRGPTASPVSTVGTAGGSLTGNVGSISGIVNAPILVALALPPATPPPVSFQPFAGGSTGVTSTSLLPTPPLWTPAPYNFPYLQPRVVAIGFPTIAPDQVSPYKSFPLSPLALSHSNGPTTVILPLESFAPLSLTHDDVPTSESPEPGTQALILAAGILACASGGLRRRLRKRHNGVRSSALHRAESRVS